MILGLGKRVQIPRGPAAVNGDETRYCHCPLGGWEGAGSRMSHEPEDLPSELTIVPSRAGEQARMKNRVQSSRSLSGLGDFLFGLAWPLDPDVCGVGCCHRDGWGRPLGLR
jgi:hypothetical protein